MLSFEFHIYDDGAAPVGCEIHSFRDGNAARCKAGRLAKKHGGPVDLAYTGGEQWADRYITTASPSEHHAAGYRFERLT